jgi:glycosyltransferase involved in cell wall biosynthesis
MVTVSVVIPTYDDAESLPDSIDSVLDQTLSDLELLIVDDCSEDDTPRVVREYTDPRITYVRHGENSGGSAARNTGIRLSEGEYIAFLDSDDTWHPTKLEKQVSCLESRSDDWIAVYCDAEYQSEGVIDRVLELYKDLTGVGRGHEGSEELIERLIMAEAFVAAGSTLLARSECVKRIGGFDEAFVRHQDWEFLIRLLEHGKCAYVDERLVSIDRSGSTSPDKRLAAKEMFLETFSEQIERHPASARNIENRHMYLSAVLYFEHGRFREGYDVLPDLRSLDGLNYAGVFLAACKGLANRIGAIIN